MKVIPEGRTVRGPLAQVNRRHRGDRSKIVSLDQSCQLSSQIFLGGGRLLTPLEGKTGLPVDAQ
jgi:hypothetical protein